jgi:enoyl-CoA hydratase/carnithine racemase
MTEIELTTEFIRLESEGGVARLTLNRPEVLNAWHGPMRKEIVAALRALEADPDVRSVVITGAGDRAFCAGQDLNEATNFGPDEAEVWIEEWRAFFGAIRALSKPVVAAINGVAAGSAFQAALYTDIRIGHPGVRMGQPEINSGIASVTGPYIMREILGLPRTVELTLSGRLMNADEALEAGALHRVVPAEDLLPTAYEIAAELGAKPAVAMGIDKAWLREMTEPGFQAAMEAAKRYHRVSFESGEPQRRTAAFLAKRARRKG